MQLFTRLDVKTGEAQSWCPGDRCFCEELIFVPGPRGDVEEDDGVLLGMVFDGESMRTSLAVGSSACPASIVCYPCTVMMGDVTFRDSNAWLRVHLCRTNVKLYPL